MPEAHAILWFLGAFLALWGLTLILRGIVGERTGPGRQCPMCRKGLAAGSLTCVACGYEAPDERIIRSRRRSWPMTGAGVGVEAIATLSFVAGQRIYVWTHRDPSAEPGVSLWECAALATLCFSLVLIAWAVTGDRSRGRRRCPMCWYDMSGAVGLRCPECGHECSHTRQLYRSRRRWRWVPAGLVGLLLAAGTWEYPRYHAGGVVALVPTTALIAGLWSLPDQYIMQRRSPAPEDWSLLHRFQENKVASWQQQWLASKVGAALRDPPSPEAFLRAIQFRSNWWSSGSGSWQGDELADSGRIERAFARWLSSDDAGLRARAANAFPAMLGRSLAILSSSELQPLVPGLRAALADPNPGVGRCAAYLLASIAAEHTTIIDAVTRDVRSGGTRVSYAGAVVFGRIAEHGGAGLVRAAADRLLTSTDAADRTFALVILHQVFDNDPTARRSIRDRLNDPDDTVAGTAAGSIIQTPGETVPPEFIAALRTRANAASRLQMLGVIDNWSGTVPVADLASLLTDESDPANKALIAHLLERAAGAGHDMRPAMTALQSAAQSQDPSVAQAAATALTTIQNRGRGTPPP